MAERQATVILPILYGDFPSPPFITDLIESIMQIRLRELHSVIVVHCGDDADTTMNIAPLSKSFTVQELVVAPSATLIEMINAGCQRCVETETDALVVQREGTIAPNTLSELCAVSRLNTSFAILSAKSNLGTDVVDDEHPPLPQSGEHSFLSFLELSPKLPRWTETNKPSPGCFLVTNQALKHFLPFSTNYASVSGALWELVSRCFTNGLDAVHVNTAYHFASPDLVRGSVLVTQADVDRLTSECVLFSRRDDSRDWSPASVKEGFLSLGAKPKGVKPTLLLDLGELAPGLDLVAEFGRALGQAIHARREWKTTILCREDVKKQHRLESQFEDGTFIHSRGDQVFDATLSLTPPKNFARLEELLQSSPHVFSLMTDSLTGRHRDTPISRAESQAILALTAQCSQGLVFVGSTAQSIFQQNYPQFRELPQVTILPSMYYKEYQRDAASAGNLRAGTAIVIGTLDQPRIYSMLTRHLLASFTKTAFHVFGPEESLTKESSCIPPAAATSDYLASRCGQAEVVVVPYLTEALSLIVARALAAGRVVVAMQCPLLDEIQRSWSGPGGIIGCDTTEQLIESTRRMLDTAERHNFFKTRGSERSAKSTVWRWNAISTIVTEMMFTAIKAKKESKHGWDPLVVLNATSLAVSLERSDTAKAHAAQVAELERKVVSLEQRVKELQAAQTVLKSSSSYQLGSAMAKTLQSIPGFRGKAEK
jgi:hypothetical protein